MLYVPRITMMKECATIAAAAGHNPICIPIEYISSPFEENYGERTYIKNSNQCSYLTDVVLLVESVRFTKVLPWNTKENWDENKLLA